MTEAGHPLRVLFICTGLGIMNRGIESFFKEAFAALNQVQGLDLCLLKGAGVETGRERVLCNLPRTTRLSRLLGRMVRRKPYVIEQWSSFPSALRQLSFFKPQLVYYSDANLGFLLHKLRDRIGVPFNLLFSNGGPVHPPFERTDYVHQVAPAHYQEAMRAGEPCHKHFLLPYGIHLIARPEPMSTDCRNLLRRRLALPADRKVVLSVGWIRRVHKRMDYLIKEIASLPPPRPFLQLVGAVDAESAEVFALGERLLGRGGFAVCSVPYGQVFDYYRAVDCFVLASLEEGFGRVYLEALMHGLPVIAHRNPVTEYVLGTHAILTDLSRPGALTRLLHVELQRLPCRELMQRRWMAVRDRFGWEVLAPLYREMFEACC